MIKKNKNPYPKTIHDEDSGADVLNAKWVAWEEGRKAGTKSSWGDWEWVFTVYFILGVGLGALLYSSTCNLVEAIKTAEVSMPITQTIYRDFYVTQVVPEEVIKEVTVEVVKSAVSVPVPIELKEWQSLDQLHDMVQNIITFQPSICLQTAENIQQIALEQGYPVSIALALNGNYYQQNVTNAPGGHAGLLVEVKDGWYFIDPQPWRVTKLW